MTDLINAWPFSPEEVKALRAGTWEISGPYAQLTDFPHTSRGFSGGGWVRQRPSSLSFEFYGEEREFGEELKGQDEASESLPGRYDLRFRDHMGREWTAGDVYPDRSYWHPFAVPSTKSVFSGEIAEITFTVDVRPGASEMWMYIPGRLAIPENATLRTELRVGRPVVSRREDRIWLLEDDGLRITVRRLEDGLDLSVRSDEPFEPGLDTRLEEALWFVLARPVSWSVLFVTSAGQLSASIRPGPPPGVGRIHPPLELRRPHSADLHNLFFRFLRHTVAEGQLGYYAPTAAQILRVLRASTSTIDDEGQALCNAVESIVRANFSEFGVPGDEAQRELEAARAHLEGEAVAAPLRPIAERLSGQVRRWSKFHERTALIALVEHGVIQEEERVAWEKVRHPVSHGHFLSAPGADLEALVRDCDLIHRLLLRLLFRRIGYDGPFTDRTVYGWPVRDAGAVTDA